MKSPTRQLQVEEQLPFSEQDAVRLGPLEFADPCVFDNAEDEFPCFALCGFVRGAGERGGVIRRIIFRVLDDTDEVMYLVLLVVRNDEEDLGKHLAEFRKM